MVPLLWPLSLKLMYCVGVLMLKLCGYHSKQNLISQSKLLWNNLHRIFYQYWSFSCIHVWQRLVWFICKLGLQCCRLLGLKSVSCYVLPLLASSYGRVVTEYSYLLRNLKQFPMSSSSNLSILRATEAQQLSTRGSNWGPRLSFVTN